MAEKLLLHGVARDRIHLIPNWANDVEITPIPHIENPLRREWGLEGRFVVGYSGNLGRAHEFETVLAASERLRSNSRILFLCVGSGHKFDQLVRCVQQRGLSQNFQFVPYQEIASLKYSLCVPDLHWISLKPELEGLVLPSKLYGIAAAGRPILAITASDGEIAQLIRQHGCGMVIAPGRPEVLAEAIVSLSDDPVRTAQMGRRARAMLDRYFTRQHAFERWRDVLQTMPEAADDLPTLIGRGRGVPPVSRVANSPNLAV
jgi:glycosyltransferase involved in cell wall biosynthesis